MEIVTIDSFIQYYARIRSRTMRVVECIPPRHIEWTYKTGKFTLGDLARHIAAIERYMFVEIVCGRENRYPGHDRAFADGAPAVAEYMRRLHAESLALLRGIGDNELNEKCRTPAGSPISKWKWLRAMVEHEIHHRGQMYLYLAQLDATPPPLYGLTAEEVHERSLPLN